MRRWLEASGPSKRAAGEGLRPDVRDLSDFVKLLLYQLGLLIQLPFA